MDLEQYIIQGEPGRRERAEAWQVAIGLQAVDGLKPSKYLLQTAQDHIEERISFDEVDRRIASYYQTVEGRREEAGTDEADGVSARIARLLAEDSFTFSPAMLASIHRRLFEGILPRAGRYRIVNIKKKEWVLDGASVLYSSADMISATLDYDFDSERSFSYKGIDLPRVVKRISSFVSGIWQIHPFGEGNTRTTAVFTIKYLRQLGFKVDNEPFKLHSWYFRNALVRANYQDLPNGVERTTEFLELFFRNLLMGEHNELRNRYLHIHWNDGFVGVREEGVPYGYGNGSGKSKDGSEKNSDSSERDSEKMEAGSEKKGRKSKGYSEKTLDGSEKRSRKSKKSSEKIANGSEKVKVGSEKGSEEKRLGSKYGLEESSVKKGRGVVIGSDEMAVGPVKTWRVVLGLLARDPYASAGSVAAEIGISSRAVEKHISRLKARGLLSRVGPDKGGYWQVNE